MNVRQRGLGRGLGALIPTAPGANGDQPASGPTGPTGPNAFAAAPGAEPGPPDPSADMVPGAHFAELPVAAIRPNPRQPRTDFDEDALAELVASVREVGLLQPVVVRRAGGGDGAADPAYELVMGERRWRAVQEAGLPTIPAIVRDTGDDAMLRDALLENLHRQQLNPLEEAAAYDQLLKEFGATHEVLADRIGRSRSQVTNTLRLLKLPPGVQRRVAAGVLSAGHARALLALDDPEAQDRLAQRIVAEGLSVRAVEEIVAVGDTGGAARRAPRRKPVAPALEDLAARLADRFDTRVRVDLGRRKGRIVVEFASIDDLGRIIGLMAPGAEVRHVAEAGQDGQDGQDGRPAWADAGG